MATLSVWKFDDPSSATRAIDTLEELQRQDLIKIDDAAVVSWPADKKRPKTKQLHNLTGAGRAVGSFWGLLFGLLFFVPLFGMAVGRQSARSSGSLADVGIDDEFIAALRSEVQPGSSALFVMTSDAVQDRVHDTFAGQQATLLHRTSATRRRSASASTSKRTNPRAAPRPRSARRALTPTAQRETLATGFTPGGVMQPHHAGGDSSRRTTRRRGLQMSSQAQHDGPGMGRRIARDGGPEGGAA